MIWTKEEIMAYVDGQLDQNNIARIENAINEDNNANEFYESLIESNDLINVTYQKIENTYIRKSTENQSSYNNKEEKKSKIPKLNDAIAIGYKGLIGLVFFGIVLIISTYQIGKNSQNILNKQQATEMFAIKNILKNKEIIQNHIGQNNLNDLRIQMDNNTSAVVRFKYRSQDKDKFCQNFIVEIEGIDYDLTTCNNLSNKEDRWNYQLQKVLD